jgi:hypothetical protein
VQEANSSAAGIAPELARKETVMSPILTTPLYTLTPVNIAIRPSRLSQDTFVTLLPGDGLPSISLPLLVWLPALSCCNGKPCYNIMNYLFGRHVIL